MEKKREERKCLLYRFLEDDGLWSDFCTRGMVSQVAGLGSVLMLNFFFFFFFFAFGCSFSFPAMRLNQWLFWLLMGDSCLIFGQSKTCTHLCGGLKSYSFASAILLKPI
jgi:hypothetical protein